MSAIQKIFQVYGPQYLALYGDRMPQLHKKTIKDITDCRSGSFGTIVYACHDCGAIRSIPCCCGNRHCPTCQQNKADQWLQDQMDQLLPTHYFLLTITLPQGLRYVARSNQKIVYKALFSCAHEALTKLARDKRFVGSTRIGYLAVLHTWGNTLQYHPHLHIVIPGGAVSEKGNQWLSSRQDLFVHTKPLTLIFKAGFRDAMKKAQLLDKIDPDLQHVLPKGLMKIRRYGFFNPNSSFSIGKLRELISLIHDVVTTFLPETPEHKEKGIKCACCGSPLKFIAFLKPLPGWGPSG